MVYLVGAGMGDSELITLKGLKCIQKADVIVYDHLANPSLLNYASDGCLLIYVGKQSDKHTMPQEEINKTLVQYGRDKMVVRLKGGDSFVFGRGGEEVNALVENGVDFELVPGVSSSYGAAEYAGIPVTHRGVASSFHVITGHEQRSGETVNYEALSKLSGTLVFLMGHGNAKSIADSLIQSGKDGDTKAAIISNAGTEKQKIVTGTLKQLPQMADKMQPPAVIVIGDVVGLQNEWYKPSQKKILTTGTKQINSSIKKAFGDIPVTEISLIKTTPINQKRLRELNLTEYTHLVFTSANGVDIFFDELKNAGLDMRLLGDIKYLTVGHKTAQALAQRGVFAYLIPTKQNSASLIQSLVGEYLTSVLVVRAENGKTTLVDWLEKQNLPYTDLPLYKTETDYSKKELLNLTAPDMDYIIFSSGSAARAYAEMAEQKTNARLISIGTETTKAAEQCGLEIYKTAPVASAESVYETIIGDEEND